MHDDIPPTLDAAAPPVRGAEVPGADERKAHLAPAVQGAEVPCAVERHAHPAVLWSALAVLVSTVAGAALAPYLAVHHPLWLLALNPWPRHQLLVAPQLPLLPFVAIISARGVWACTVAFELGRCYGRRGVEFLTGRFARGGRLIDRAERWFARFSGLVLWLAPGIGTSAVAGMSGLPRARSLLLTTAGLVTWTLVNYRLGAWLAPLTGPLLAFVRENMLVTTLACCALVALYHLSMRRRA